MGSAPILVENIFKTFWKGKSALRALDGISFQIDVGEVVCLLGPNGSGKTTTMKCICNLIRPDSGSVRVNGEDLSGNPKLLTRLGVLFEGSRNIYPYLSSIENIRYYSRISGFQGRNLATVIDGLLEQYSLSDRRDDPAYRLSMGMQQKVALCCVLAADPPILLLDEPTSGLDIQTKREVVMAIKKMKADGKSVLLMTHQMDVAEKVADRVIVLSRGRIIKEGSPSLLKSLFETGGYQIHLDESFDMIPQELVARYSLVQDESGQVRAGGDQSLLLELLQELGNVGLHVLSMSKELTLEESLLRIMEDVVPS